MGLQDQLRALEILEKSAEKSNTTIPSGGNVLSSAMTIAGKKGTSDVNRAQQLYNVALDVNTVPHFDSTLTALDAIQKEAPSFYGDFIGTLKESLESKKKIAVDNFEFQRNMNETIDRYNNLPIEYNTGAIKAIGDELINFREQVNEHSSEVDVNRLTAAQNKVGDQIRAIELLKHWDPNTETFGVLDSEIPSDATLEDKERFKQVQTAESLLMSGDSKTATIMLNRLMAPMISSERIRDKFNQRLDEAQKKFDFESLQNAYEQAADFYMDRISHHGDPARAYEETKSTNAFKKGSLNIDSLMKGFVDPTLVGIEVQKFEDEEGRKKLNKDREIFLNQINSSIMHIKRNIQQAYGNDSKEYGEDLVYNSLGNLSEFMMSSAEGRLEQMDAHGLLNNIDHTLINLMREEKDSEYFKFLRPDMLTDFGHIDIPDETPENSFDIASSEMMESLIDEFWKRTDDMGGKGSAQKLKSLVRLRKKLLDGIRTGLLDYDLQKQGYDTSTIRSSISSGIR